MKLRSEIKRVANMMENRWSEFDDTKGDSYKKMDLRDLIALASKNYNNGSLRISSDREMDTSMVDLVDAMNLITMILIHRGILEQLPIELDDIPHTGLGIGKDIEDHIPAPPEPRTLHGTSFLESVKEITDENAKIEVTEEVERSESEKVYAGEVTDSRINAIDYGEAEAKVAEYIPPKATLRNPTVAKTLQETMDEGKIQAIMDAEIPLENEKEDSDDNV